VTSMGGAATGLSDDVTGININPAGLVWGKWWGDLGGNINRVSNLEADLNGDTLKDGLPYSYFYYAGALNFGSWAFGLGVSSPYQVELEFAAPNGAFIENRKMELQITSADFPFSLKIGKKFSIGITLHARTLREAYEFRSTDPANPTRDLEQEITRTNATLGMAWQMGKRFRLGWSHTFRESYAVDVDMNTQLPTTDFWFRPVIVPAKSRLGMSWIMSDSILYVMDFDYIEPARDAVYVGSELITPGFNRVDIRDKDQFVLHGGFEWHAIETNLWDLFLRWGAYHEPARVVDGISRGHVTLGMEVRFWVLAVAVAVDGAEDFSNTTGGVGISLKNFID